MSRMSGSTSLAETSYACSPGLMGSTSHLANELGNENGDHSTIDGRIVYYRTAQCYLGAGAKAGSGSKNRSGSDIFKSSLFGSESRSDFLKIYIFFIFFIF